MKFQFLLENAEGILPLKLLFCTINSRSFGRKASHSGSGPLSALSCKCNVFKFVKALKSGSCPVRELPSNFKVVRSRRSLKLGEMAPVKFSADSTLGRLIQNWNQVRIEMATFQHDWINLDALDCSPVPIVCRCNQWVANFVDLHGGQYGTFHRCSERIGIEEIFRPRSNIGAIVINTI